MTQASWVLRRLAAVACIALTPCCQRVSPMAIYNIDGCGNLGPGEKKARLSQDGKCFRLPASGFRLPASSDFRLKDEALRIIIVVLLKARSGNWGMPCNKIRLSCVLFCGSLPEAAATDYRVPSASASTIYICIARTILPRSRMGQRRSPINR